MANRPKHIDLTSSGTAPLQFSRHSLQALDSNVCGHYCILFLYVRLAILHTAHVTHASSSRALDFATSISILSELDPSRRKRDLAVYRTITQLLQKHPENHFDTPSAAPSLNPPSGIALLPTAEGNTVSLFSEQHSQPWKPLLEI